MMSEPAPRPESKNKKQKKDPSSKDLLRLEHPEIFAASPSPFLISEVGGTSNGAESKDPKAKKLTTTFIEPSSVLSRLQSFLPAMAEANRQLEGLSREQIDIENVKGSKNVIQLDLGLGVFDVKETSNLSEEQQRSIFGSEKAIPLRPEDAEEEEADDDEGDGEDFVKDLDESSGDVEEDEDEEGMEE